MNRSNNEKSREYERRIAKEYALFDVNSADRDKFNFQSGGVGLVHWINFS